MSAFSGLVQGISTQKAAGEAASAADYATQVQYQMWQEAQQQFEPFLNSGVRGVKDLQQLVFGQGPYQAQQEAANKGVQDMQLTSAPNANFSVNPVTGQIMQGAASVSENDIMRGGELSPDVPQLRQNVNLEFDPNDPIYKYKQEQLNEQVNRQLSARGLYDSRAGLDVLADANMNLTASEIDKQYNRAIAERDYLTQTAADQYSLNAQRGQTLYDRLYSQQTDLYNRLYGQAQTEDQRKLGLLGAQQASAQNLYSQEYQGALDLTKIGTGAASSAGLGSIQTGQGIANTAMAGGTNAANAQLAMGQIGSNTIGGAASAILDYYRQPSTTTAATSAIQSASNYYAGAGTRGVTPGTNTQWH